MRVQIATRDDIPCWLELAVEVEHLFGPMVDQPDFHRALEKNILRQSAFCIRENDEPSGAPLMGAILFSPSHPRYEIGWLSVAERWRRRGVGQLLVEHVFALIVPPAELTLTTFADGAPGGGPAREFYRSLGFQTGELCDGPFEQPRQIFRRVFP